MIEVEQLPFEKFGFSPELLSGLADLRIEEPTPLQNEVIPHVLQGRNLLVKNETGDTGVFLIPALHKLNSNGEVSGTRILILTPSVERVKLIDEAIWAMGYHAQISSASLSMKGNREEQEQALLAKAPVVVANPGRLSELLDSTRTMLSDVELLIIDEAHGMEDHNLVKRVREIMQKLDGTPQTIILSETANNAVKELASFLLKDAEVLGFDEPIFEEKKEAVPQEDSATQGQDNETEESVEPEQEYVVDQDEINRKLEQASVKVVLNPEKKDEEEKNIEDSSSDENEPEPVPEDLTQAYIYVPPRAKISTLLAHLEKTLTDKIVVFAASKRTTDRLFRIIKKKGWGVVSVDDRIDEQTYQERFGKFVSGEMKILLIGGLPATRLDLNEVKQVINYDVPSEVEEYRYRAELVGSGKATRMISLVSKMDKKDMDAIVEKVGYAPTEIPLPEEVKEKKKGRKKTSNTKERKKSTGRAKSKKKEAPKNNGLPRPTYDGLSGGREGGRKRPEAAEGDGAFGWIKKLFS